jgi:hypothetical protein
MSKPKEPYELWYGIALPPAAVRLIKSAPDRRIPKAAMLRFRSVGAAKMRKLERAGALFGYEFTDELQPRPVSRDYPSGVEASVCADIADRQRKGIAKYGLTVAENPLKLKQWLQHAYEETLDKAVYLKRAILEMEGVV